MDPRDPGDRFEAAEALDRAGRSDEAAEALRALVADVPDFGAAWALLGTIDAIARRHDAALEALQRAAALLPHDGAVFNNLGNLLGTLGRGDEALAAFARSLQLRPDHAPTHHNRGKLLRRGGRPDLALEAFDAAIAIDPDFAPAWYSRASLLSARAYELDTEADRVAAAEAWRGAGARGVDPVEVGFALASLGEADPPPAAPRFYVEGLFDRYAQRFDQHLVDVLGYRTPFELCALLTAGIGIAQLATVDLGCGTGLCGPLLRPIAEPLVGVDLSELMLDEARARNCYDRLHHEELVAHLAARPATYDLAVAADVLVYIGDLAPLLGAAYAALRPGGRLGLSVERLDAAAPEGYRLLRTRRYAHRTDYVRAVATAAGFRVDAAEDRALRREGPGWIEGTLFVLARPQEPARG